MSAVFCFENDVEQDLIEDDESTRELCLWCSHAPSTELLLNLQIFGKKPATNDRNLLEKDDTLPFLKKRKPFPKLKLQKNFVKYGWINIVKKGDCGQLKNERLFENSLKGKPGIRNKSFFEKEEFL